MMGGSGKGHLGLGWSPTLKNPPPPHPPRLYLHLFICCVDSECCEKKGKWNVTCVLRVEVMMDDAWRYVTFLVPSMTSLSSPNV